MLKLLFVFCFLSSFFCNTCFCYVHIGYLNGWVVFYTVSSFELVLYLCWVFTCFMIIYLFYLENCLLFLQTMNFFVLLLFCQVSQFLLFSVYNPHNKYTICNYFSQFYGLLIHAFDFSFHSVEYFKFNILCMSLLLLLLPIILFSCLKNQCEICSTILFSVFFFALYYLGSCV